MAKMEGEINVNVSFIDKAQMIIDSIDRRCRDAVQRRDAARGEATEMYYEGMRAALAEAQAYAEKVKAI